MCVMSRKHCPIDVILTEAPEATLATTERFSTLLGDELVLEFELFPTLSLETPWSTSRDYGS
jgi:hypothetical protein